MTKHNLDKLVKVTVNDFFRSDWYTYESKPKKYFWQRKQGFYKNYMYNDYIGKDAPKNHTLINGIVYENPEVVMNFDCGIRKVKYFSTLKEAIAFAEKITRGKNWLLS